MKRRPAIVVDFDGVICENKFPDVGEPTEGVQEALNTLKKAGFRIIIHSCRTSFSFKDLLMGNQLDRIKDYMKHYKLHFDDIWVPDKPVGIAYIDDKAMKFKDNWGEITENLLIKAQKIK
ncbi:MAG: hypothetical protein SCARUB_03468 [Candidatus Scalindua rubra]|uniref:Uncharacterized protein n=1 Tax=Candidatus Scalindua rubra TaxID=1872076 RepID=A0A1E3X769_9BACT|nr:MAG: hypothetical protein SCARUB_03468 [Candidatus Scalindua rubra]